MLVEKDRSGRIKTTEILPVRFLPLVTSHQRANAATHGFARQTRRGGINLVRGGQRWSTAF
jgi:hypothetical protein